MELTVQELKEEHVEPLVDYWINSTPEYLHSLGAVASKLPEKKQLELNFRRDINKPYSQKKSYALVWLRDNVPIGHSNVNKIKYREHAYMHLHLWDKSNRRRGYGSQLVRKSLPFYFKNLELQTLFCEPYSLNDAPNKTLIKAGFRFVDGYKTIPGTINYEQIVHLYQIKREELSL